jgi:NAD(P)-dependent dehydrogenase (short-subunit alcohol dehydrogenase family)
VIDEIRALHQREDAATFLPLQLDNLESVKNCADSFLTTGHELHLLVNNAGLAGAKGLTRQGFELAFGVNHVGHFLLTQLLMPRLIASAPSRVVNVASRAHLLARSGIPWETLQKPSSSLTGISEYAVSKLANILFNAQLAKELAGTQVSCYALHPGVVDTQVWREVPKFLQPIMKWRGMLTPEQGAQTSLYCALEAPATETGLYYDKCKVKTPSVYAQDPIAAQKLWVNSMQWVSHYLSA